MEIKHKIVTKRAKWASHEPQGEISIHTHMTNATIIVAIDGWNYRDQSHDAHNPTQRGAGYYVTPDSRGKQVRISMNGPLMLTMDEWKKINEYIEAVFLEVTDEWINRGLTPNV